MSPIIANRFLKVAFCFCLSFVTSVVQTQEWEDDIENCANCHSPAITQLSRWSSNRTIETGLSRATNLHGVPLPSLTASQAIGVRGHLLFQDFHLIDKLASFAREKIPERIVHGKGAGAHGYFTVTHDISHYTKAKFLNGIGKSTPVFVRFSVATGEAATPDSSLDALGFAIKFYTEDGNHDIPAFSIEPFSIRDPMLFSEINRSRKRNPVTNLRDRNMWWDFVSLRPETTMATLHLFSDNGRPDGYRRINGFGAHAFKFVNSNGEIIFAKFHFITNQPAKALTHVEAAELAASNPDYFTQDLYDSIENGDYPTWDLYLQLMTVEQAKNYKRNAFDITRPWRVEDFPLVPVGKLTLDRNPTDFFTEVEQVGFAPSNMVPGIEPSPDRMLHARLFSYQDAQRYRIGVNGAQLPINRPVVPVTSYNRNGFASYGDNGAGAPSYYPNSFGGAEPDVAGAGQVGFSVEGVVDRYDLDEDEFVETRLWLKNDVDEGNRRRMINAIADWLKDANKIIRKRVYKNNFYPIGKSFGDEVREATEKAARKTAENRFSKRISIGDNGWLSF